jgi:hypothetical protein
MIQQRIENSLVEGAHGMYISLHYQYDIARLTGLGSDGLCAS